MLTHDQIWTAIDRLAAQAGLSPSGLARRAGLDPTTFNKSKRVTPDGRQRWPSTESIAKSLGAAGVTPQAFFGLVTTSVPAQTVPMLGMAEAAADGRFDAGGHPIAAGWDAIALPAVTEEHAFALEIADENLQPIYRRGDFIVVSPASPMRRGDRVVAKIRTGLIVRALIRRTAKTIDLQTLDGAKSESFAAEDIAWLARIVWASQ